MENFGSNQNHPAAPLPEPYDQSRSGGTVEAAKDPPTLIDRFPCKHGEAGALQHTVDIKRYTLKIEPHQKDTEKYRVEFIYNAHVAGRIELNFFELVGRTTKELFKIEEDVTKGLDQKFIQKDGVYFPSHKYGYKEVYHLEIKTQATEDNGIFQTTLAVFEEVMGKTQVRVKNQTLSVNGKTSVYVDLKGFRYPMQFDKNDRYGGCRICYLKDNPGIHDPIGKLLLSDKIIGQGSDETVVCEGTYGGQAVAVKKIKEGHCDVGNKEIQILQGSDHHPNIVRFYAKEVAKGFVLIALEKCECSLHELISSRVFESGEYKLTLEGFTGLKLWKPDGIYPLEPLLELMRDTVRGLAHLHKHGITHRNLKHQNVLIHKDTSISAKLSNYSLITTGIGSAEDLSDLGRLFCFCITGGDLPFDDENVQEKLKSIPEAHDLISRLLDPNPQSRPIAAEVCNHPLFWDAEKCLSYIKDVSDCVDPDVIDAKTNIRNLIRNMNQQTLRGKWVKYQKSHNVTNSKILNSLESLQGYSEWNNKIHSKLIDDLQKHRRYDYDSICDLLRFIRNCLNHSQTLLEDSKRLLEAAGGLWIYFSSKFPTLLMEVYKVLVNHCVNEELLNKYY